MPVQCLGGSLTALFKWKGTWPIQFKLDIRRDQQAHFRVFHFELELSIKILQVHSLILCWNSFATLIPAVEGDPGSGDFSVTTEENVQHPFFIPIPNAPVVEFIYRVDGEREQDETFALELYSDSELLLPTGPGVFYRQTLQCTIVDGGDTVKFS